MFNLTYNLKDKKIYYNENPFYLSGSQRFKILTFILWLMLVKWTLTYYSLQWKLM